MATATTVRLDIRQSLLATAVALADGQAWLVKTRPGSADAAAARLVALSATALAAKQGANADLQADAIRAILQLDMALTAVTQTCLGRRAECIVAWTM